MFFGLVAVDDHPCCGMQEVVEDFFSNSIESSSFTVDLFPSGIRSAVANSGSMLGTKFSKVHALLHDHQMSVTTRRAIHQQVKLTNRIQDLCDGVVELRDNVIDWASPLGVAIDDLMSSLYTWLDLGVFRRNAQLGNPTHQLYSEFIDKNKYVCPFCGLAKFKNRRGARREDFDHYLNLSRYRLAAANTKNLVPTCGTCNQDYKKAKDILADGLAFYPYASIPKVKVEVECRTYPAVGDLTDPGQWSVKQELVQPDPTAEPKITAWNRVYSIKKRLEDEIQEFFENWMAELADDQPQPLEQGEFFALIASAKTKAIQNSERRMEPGQIIKAAFFDFMLFKAEKRFVESFRRLQNGRCAII